MGKPIEGKYGNVATTVGTFHEGEPVFLFRGQDPFTPEMILEYARRCEEAGCDPAYVEDLRQRAERVAAWQAANPALVKTRPD